MSDRPRFRPDPSLEEIIERAMQAPPSSSSSQHATRTPAPSGRRGVGIAWFISIVSIVLVIIMAVYTISVGAGTHTQSNSSNTNQVDTSTPQVDTSVLYQEDGSDNWNGWNGSSDWHTDQNLLRNDGSGHPGTWIIAPYQPGSENINDYAVQANIEVENGCWTFGIIVRADPNQQQNNYAAGIKCETDTHVNHAVIWSWGGEGDYNILQYNSFEPGTTFNTYRVEVKGNDIKLLINGSLIVETADNQYSSGGQVGIWADNIQIAISSFKVIAI